MAGYADELRTEMKKAAQKDRRIPQIHPPRASRDGTDVETRPARTSPADHLSQ